MHVKYQYNFKKYLENSAILAADILPIRLIVTPIHYIYILFGYKLASYNISKILELLHHGFGDHKIYDCLIIEHVTSTQPTPIGHGIFYFTFSTWSGKQLFLEDVYVAPDHRSKCIATYL